MPPTNINTSDEYHTSASSLHGIFRVAASRPAVVDSAAPAPATAAAATAAIASTTFTLASAFSFSSRRSAMAAA